MAVVNTEKQVGPIDNRWLHDPRLSLKAKGLLAYICSYGANYRLTIQQMMRESTCGRDAIYTGLRELESLGYLRRSQSRSDKGKYSTVDYYLTDPFTTSSDNPQTGIGLSTSSEVTR